MDLKHSIVYRTTQIKYNNLEDISSSVAENIFQLELFSKSLGKLSIWYKEKGL